MNDLLGLHLFADDVDTIGGWIMMQKQTIIEGDVIETNGWIFKVLEKDVHQIKRVEIKKLKRKIQQLRNLYKLEV